MPLSFFNYETKSHFREVPGKRDEFGHTFGGNPAAVGTRFRNCEPIHLLYRLNQSDPVVNLNIPGVRWLPLCYHFSYAAYDGTLIYRVLMGDEIELIRPTDAQFDPEFPFPGFPKGFPPAPFAFEQQPYDPTRAEDALELAAVFGLDDLSESEIKRAIVIAEETSKTISDCSLPDCTDEEKLRL